MTGIGWIDGTACAAFIAVTLLTLVRLGRARGRFLDDAFHAVMGVTMTAMFWPGAEMSPTPVWIALIGLIVVWPLLVLALAARRSEAADGLVSVGGRVAHTGYWLTCALLMVVSVGAGHERKDETAGLMTTLAAQTPPVGGHSPTSHSVGAESGLGEALQTMAGWPIWPLVGVGFLVYAGVLLLGPQPLLGPRRPITERACAAVMAAGMSLMAFSL